VEADGVARLVNDVNLARRMRLLVRALADPTRFKEV
jgi:hypothetical protein